MNIRYICAVITAAGLLSSVASAQTTNPTGTSPAETSMPQTSGAQRSTTGHTVTLVGCVQTEADYRRAQNAGPGGVAMTGAGLGNEYVLIQTEGAGGPGGYDPQNADCKSSTAFAGTAYELSGERESELKQLVGRRVEITGELKHADDQGRPGGFDPPVVSTDLRLQELNVASFREQTMTAQAAAAPAQSQPAESQEVTAQATDTTGQTPREVGTSGQQTGTMASGRSELPNTASPLALAGLLGLFSLGGAVALRFARRS